MWTDRWNEELDAFLVCLLFASSNCGVHVGVDALILKGLMPTFSALNNIVFSTTGSWTNSSTSDPCRVRTMPASQRVLEKTKSAFQAASTAGFMHGVGPVFRQWKNLN